tara:strand:+ start:152 stop:2257 length:2106 start_codon:yes stop_codon:yes gene_type:complete
MNNKDTINVVRSTKINSEQEALAILQMIQNVDWRITWIRELIMNAIEATVLFLSKNPDYKGEKLYRGKGLIEVRALPIPQGLTGYIPKKTPWKLSFLNLGGQSGEELVKHQDLYSSSKETGRKKNLGSGKKVNLYAFTEYLEISRKNDEVHHIWCRVEDPNAEIPKFGIINDTDCGGHCCTEWAEKNAELRGYDMSPGAEWTEIIILGNDIESQNTIRYPSDKDNGVHENYYTKEIGRRFVDIPDNVAIRYVENPTKDKQNNVHSAGRDKKNTHGYGHGHLYFSSFEKKVDEAQKKYLEAGHPEKYKPRIIRKKFTSGIEILYGYDTTVGRTDSRSWIGSSIASQFHNVFSSLNWGSPCRERFDIRDGVAWKALASRLGIHAKHKNFFVQINLPFDGYENKLSRAQLHPTSLNHYKYQLDAVKLEDFKEEIKQWPQEIADLIEEHNAESISAEGDIEELTRKFFLEMNPDLDPKFSDDEKEKRKSGKRTTKVVDDEDDDDKKTDKRPRTFKKRQPKLDSFKLPNKQDRELGQILVKYIPDGNGGHNDMLYWNPEHPHIDKLLKTVTDELKRRSTTPANRKVDWYIDENADKTRARVIDCLIAKASAWVFLGKSMHYSTQMSREEYDDHIKPMVMSAYVSQQGIEKDSAIENSVHHCLIKPDDLGYELEGVEENANMDKINAHKAKVGKAVQSGLVQEPTIK